MQTNNVNKPHHRYMHCIYKTYRKIKSPRRHLLAPYKPYNWVSQLGVAGYYDLRSKNQICIFLLSPGTILN